MIELKREGFEFEDADWGKGNYGDLFFRSPSQYSKHGDLYFWMYLKERLSVYTFTAPSALGVLTIISRIFFEVTGSAMRKDLEAFAKKSEELGHLSGFPIDCNFLLKRTIPLLLENFCYKYEYTGDKQLKMVKVQIKGGSAYNPAIPSGEWMLPAECMGFLEGLIGDEMYVVKDTVNSPMVEKAFEICFKAHRKQVDLCGKPYIFHPVHLAEQMDTEAEICTALLHDVVEDSDYTLEDLKKAGFSQEVLDAVALMTHAKEVPYMEYVCAIRKNEIARKVKMADLRHNSDTKRKPVVLEKDQKRLQKYKVALAILEDDYYDVSLKHYRKRIPLDDQRKYFLSVFYKQDGTVEKYSLDVETASDTHIEFDAGCEEKLLKALHAEASLPEALAEYMKLDNVGMFKYLLDGCGIQYKEFHFD